MEPCYRWDIIASEFSSLYGVPLTIVILKRRDVKKLVELLLAFRSNVPNERDLKFFLILYTNLDAIHGNFQIVLNKKYDFLKWLDMLEFFVTCLLETF